MSSSPLSSEFIPAAAAGKYPKAWVAGAVATGVKKTSLDLTLVRSLVPVKAVSGVFTLNSFAAAPVQVCKSLLLQARGQDQEQLKLPQGVVVNSGCANACTGQGKNHPSFLGV